MYTLFHVKNCFNKIILNSINRYLIKKNNYTEFIYMPINVYTHNLWATRRLEMQKLGAGWGEVRGFRGGVEVSEGGGGCGWCSRWGALGCG